MDSESDSEISIYQQTTNIYNTNINNNDSNNNQYDNQTETSFSMIHFLLFLFPYVQLYMSTQERLFNDINCLFRNHHRFHIAHF